MTDHGNYSNIDKNGVCEFKDSKRVVSVSEAFITEDDLKLYKPKPRPPVPTVKDTIQVINQDNVKPLIPTINETVRLDIPCNRILSRKQEVNKTKLNNLIEEQNSVNTIKVNEARQFIDKKKKERAEKNKSDLLEKKKFLDEKKKRLDQLQKTTRELAKGNKTKKQKNLPVEDKCKDNLNLPVGTNQPNQPVESEIKTIDQTWSPPSVLPKSFKKTLKNPNKLNPLNLQKMLREKSNSTYDINEHSNVSKNITKTISNNTNTIPQTSINKKNSQVREVAKPENIYSNLQLNDNYLLMDGCSYDILTPKIIHTPLVKKSHNVNFIEDICHDNEIVVIDNLSLNRKVSEIDLSTQCTNTTNVSAETSTDLQKYDENMCCVETNKNSFSDNFCPKKLCSEATQTDNNILSISSSMNLYSMLNCKNSMQQTENNDLKQLNLCKPIDNLSMNGVSISSNVDNINKNRNTDESIVLKMPDVEICDKVTYMPNFNFNVTENSLKTHKSLFVGETIDSNNLNVKTYEDIKYVMKKINCDLDLLTKNSSRDTNDNINCEHSKCGDSFNYDLDLSTKNSYSYTNDLRINREYLKLEENDSINCPSSSLPKIHDEFQAELHMLDQLNNSLCDIEKMDCDTFINKKQSIDDELNNGLSNSNESNINEIFNSYSNCLPKTCSKLNSLSSSMMSIDKTITDFSILMFKQLIKDEELRAKQHLTINSLREKSLINRLRWEVTMCDLQTTFRNFKNPLGHINEFQLFKQQHRGRLKKLENSLAHVKRLGRVIDSVYKRRIFMLDEHLLYLRMESSSKKVIRKLKSLDHIPKKEEFVNWPLNTHIFNQCDKTNTVDIAENKPVDTNSTELSVSLQNVASPIMYQTDKPKINLRDQATSPISLKTENFKVVENIQVQTDAEYSYIDKCVQTFKTCKDNKLFVPIDLSYQNEPPNVNDAKTVSSVLPISPVKVVRCVSESSISTNSEQSEVNVRITMLQEQLEARKIESSRLKKKQKKLKLESLKAKEQDILKQIELYDKKIEESKKSLMVDIEKKSNQVKQYSIKHGLFSKNFPTCSTQTQNIENDHSQNVLNKITSTNFCVPQDKQLIQLKSTELKENFSGSTNDDCESEKLIDCKSKNHPVQFSETDQTHRVVPLHKEEIVTKNCILKEYNKIQTEVDIAPFSFQQKGLTHKSNNDKNSLKNKSCSRTINKVSNTSDLPEKISSTEKITTSFESMNNNHSNTNLSKNNMFQKVLIDSHQHLDDGVSQLKVSINETEIGSVDAYSLDFMSDDNSSESQGSYEFLRINNNMIDEHNSDQNNESSYEEDRSEGDVMFEDKTFIEQYSSDHEPFQDEKITDDKIDIVTNNIFNRLIEDMKKMFKISKNKPLSFMANYELNNLTEETPLLMILKREEENQNMIILKEQAKTISDVIFQRNLQAILLESLQMYLPKLNETEVERLKLYLGWSSNKKRVELPDFLKCQHKNCNIDCDDSFEIFYQKHQKWKISPTLQELYSTLTLTQTKKKTDKLKLEQLQVGKKIELLHINDESKFFLREIPNKPPPPYKSPTKKKALDNMPYTSDEVCEIVLKAAGQLFSDPQSLMSKDYINDSDSSLHADYKTLLFDYCKEIAQDMFFEDEIVPVWKKPSKKLKHFRGRPKNPKELSDAVINKLNLIMDIDDCEEKVNTFVIKQMYVEDGKWVDFQMDEMNVQNDVVHGLIKKLIRDTVTNMETNFCLKFMC